MHDTWNPWHGCNKISEGCANCYMYFLDQMRAQDGSLIRLTNSIKNPKRKIVRVNIRSRAVNSYVYV